MGFDYSQFVDAIEVTRDKQGRYLFNGVASLYEWLSKHCTPKWNDLSYAQRMFLTAELMNALEIDLDDEQGRMFLLETVFTPSEDDYVIRVYDTWDGEVVFEDLFSNCQSEGLMSSLTDFEGLRQSLVSFGDLLPNDTLEPIKARS